MKDPERVLLVRVSVLEEEDLSAVSSDVLVLEESTGRLYVSIGGVLQAISGGAAPGGGGEVSGSAADVSFDPAPTSGFGYPLSSTNLQAALVELAESLDTVKADAITGALDGFEP